MNYSFDWDLCSLTEHWIIEGCVRKHLRRVLVFACPSPYSEVAVVDEAAGRVALALWIGANGNLGEVQQPFAVGDFKRPLELHSQHGQVSQRLTSDVHLRLDNKRWKDGCENAPSQIASTPWHAYTTKPRDIKTSDEWRLQRQGGDVL